MSMSLKDFIENNISITTERQCIFFVGAGGSFNSGIPTVMEIYRNFLKNLPLPQSEQESFIEAKFPFESFVRIIAGLIGTLDSFLDMFEQNIPSANHKFLAQLADMGLTHNIVTTNFDTLIEESLRERKIAYDVRTPPFSQESLKGDCGVSVMKLHGTITNKKQLGITFNRIINLNNIKGVGYCLRTILRDELNKTLFIIGYSFSDHFDIVPQLRTLFTNSFIKIVVIVHQNQLGTYEIEQLNQSPLKEIFGGYENGFVITCNTDEFISLLSNKLKFDQFSTEKISANWQDSITKFFSKHIHTRDRQLACCGVLQEATMQYDSAAQQYNDLLRMDVKEPRFECVANLRVGVYISREEKNLQAALPYFNAALRLIKITKKVKTLAEIYSAIGTSFAIHKKYRSALKYFRKSIKIIKKYKLGNIEEVYQEIGALYLNRRKFLLAKKYFEKAGRLSIRNANISVQIRNLISQAFIDLRLKRFGQSLKKAKIGYSMAEKVCFYDWMIVARFLMIKVLRQTSGSNELIEQYKKDMTILANKRKKERVHQIIAKI